MKMINRDNYESFAIDYIEGKLNSPLLEAFEAFLLSNPDIAEELDALPSIDSESFEYLDHDEKQNLKKGSLLSESINSSNYEMYFVAFHEGDLNEHEKGGIIAFLMQHPELQKEFDQLSQLKLEADLNLTFPHKKNLKKAVPLFSYQLVLRYAALFIFLFSIGMYFLLNKENDSLYVERDGEIELPIEENDELEFQTIEKEAFENVPAMAEKEIEPKEEPESIEQKQAIQLAITEPAEEKQDSPDLMENEPEEIIVAENTKEKEDEKSMDNIEESIDLTEPIVASVSPPEAENTTLFKFKRPRFKKDDNDDGLLASNDRETIITIAKPKKNARKKGFSFGPIKVKKGN